MISPSRLLRRAAAAPRVAWQLARHGRPQRLVLFGHVSIGDDLLCTALLHECRRRGENNLWMMTRHADLFAGNPDVDRVLPLDDYHALALRRLGVSVVQPYYVGMKPDDDAPSPAPREHFIAQMCRLAGLTGEISLRPYLHLTAAERASGRLSPRQVVIHSTGRSTKFFSANKEWFSARFQAVVHQLHDRFDFVQLGAAADPLLEGARDLRGRTTLRESAALVAASRAVVCQEGFLMHLARAVDVRAVVIYGGALHPAISGYATNENLFTPVPCAPCWQRNRCDFARCCMTAISVEDVAAALLRTDALHGETLSLDSVSLA